MIRGALTMLAALAGSVIYPNDPAAAPSYVEVPAFGDPKFQLTDITKTLNMCFINHASMMQGDQKWLEREIQYLTPEKKDWVMSACAAYSAGAFMPREFFEPQGEHK